MSLAPRQKKPKRSKIQTRNTFGCIFFAAILPVGLIPVLILGWLIYEYWRTWFSQPYEAFLQFAVGLLGAAALLVLLGSWLGARRMSAPLKKIKQTMRQFASGNLDQRIALRRNDDLAEIGDLFNSIADDYRATYQSITLRDTSGRNGHDQAISQIAGLAVSARTPAELLQGSLETLARSFSCAYAAVHWLERNEVHQTRYVALLHSFQLAGFEASILSPNARERRVNLDATPTLEWLVSRAIATGEAQVAEASIYAGLVEAAVPIKVGGRTAGVLSLFAHTRSNDPRLGPFSPRALADLSKAAGLIGLSIEIASSLAMTSTGIASSHAMTSAGVASPHAMTDRFVPRDDMPDPADAIHPAEIASFLAMTSDRIHPADRMSPSNSIEPGAEIQEQALLLYQASNWITQAETEEGALATARRALEQAPFPAAILFAPDHRAATDSHASFVSTNDQLEVIYRSDKTHISLENSEPLPLGASQLSPYFNSYAPVLAANLESDELPRPLLELAREMGCDGAAYLPALRGGLVRALLVLGRPTVDQEDTRPISHGGFLRERITSPLPLSMLGPYQNLIELLTASLEKIRAMAHTQRQLAELRIFSNVSQAISIESDLNPLFTTIHRQAEGVMGDLNSFAIALYDSRTEVIRFPYMHEEGHQLEIAPFPLGEGLTSILVRTHKPLLLMDDVEEQAQALGAKIQGQAAKSWLGAPMLYSGDVVGAIIVQDIQQEKRFNEDDQRLLTALASQVAVVVHNARLLDETRQQALQERLLNEITAKIRRSPDIQSILKTTANELGAALGVRRARIQIGFDPERLPANAADANAIGMPAYRQALHNEAIPAERLADTGPLSADKDQPKERTE